MPRMAREIDLSIFGNEVLIRKLRGLESKAQKAILRKGLREAAKMIAAEARTRAPYDTGALRKGIKVRAAKSKKYIGMIVRTGTRAEMGIPETASHYYPALLELGTSRLPARPYLRPALDEKRTRALAAIQREGKIGLEREAAK